MGAAPLVQLSDEEILALKPAAHRQLARWAKKPTFGARQQAQRNALKRAVRVLQDQAFAHDCDLRAPNGGRDR